MKTWFGWLGVVALLLPLLATGDPAAPRARAEPAPATDGVQAHAVQQSAGQALTRYFGTGRIGTAIAVSEATYDTAESVVLARADVYADALTGGPLAAQLDAPILLSPSGSLPAEVGEEIERLGASEAILLGGEAALSEQVREDVEALGVTTDRIAGTTRFDTARLIATRVGGTDAYVTEGANPDPSRGWPDAVSVSTLAASQQTPMLLVHRSVLPDETRQAMDELGTTSATIIGGTAAVSQEVQDAIAGEGVAVDRLAGKSRFETSAEVARAGEATGLSPNRTWYVTGLNWPDSLVAGPAAARQGESLLLVHGDTLDGSPSARDWTGRRRGIEGVLVGGTAAISDDVAGQLDSILTGGVGDTVGFEEYDGYLHAVDEAGRRVRLDPLDESHEAHDEPVEFPDGDSAALSTSDGSGGTVTQQAAVPSSVDLTAGQTDVRSQGGRGTCVAHAVVAAIEAKYEEQGVTLDLSEQIAHHMTKMAGLRGRSQRSSADLRESGIGWIGGFSIYTVLKRLSTYRVPTEADAPIDRAGRGYAPWGDYGSTNQSGDNPRIGWRDDAATQRTADALNLVEDRTTFQVPWNYRHTPLPENAVSAGRYGVESWSKAPSGSLNDLSWYEQQLDAGNEVLVGLTYCSNGDSDGDGIRDVVDGNCGGGHAVLLVGYDKSSADSDDHHFIVKNSWGGGARNFEKWSYDYARENKIYQAATLDSVIDPETDVPAAPRQTILGDWDMEFDGQRAQLSIYRLPGIQDPSNLTHTDGSNPSADMRVGTLYLGEDGSGDAYRVNGEVNDDGSVKLWADLDLGDGDTEQNIEFDESDDAEFVTTLRADVGDLGTIDANELIGGTVTTEDFETLGWYGSKDGWFDGTPVAPDLTGEQAFTGVWDVHAPYLDGQVIVHEINDDDTIDVTYDDGSTVKTISGSVDPATHKLDLNWSHLVSTYTGYLHTDRPGTVAGTYNHSGGRTDGDSPMVLTRVSDVPFQVEIVEPLDGESFQSGGTIQLQADVGPGEPRSEVLWYESPDKEHIIARGESASAKLPSGTFDVTVEHGDATDIVTIHVTNDGVPDPTITTPTDGSHHHESQHAPDVHVEVEGNASDPEDGTLSGDDLMWSYREKGDTSWIDSGVRGTSGTLELRDEYCGFTAYEIRLTAIDSNGNSKSHVIEITIQAYGC